MANNTGQKFGGRKRGTPNKTKIVLHSFINYIIEDGFDKFKLELDKLNGKDFINIFIKLLNSTIDTSEHEKLISNDYLIKLIELKLKNEYYDKK